MEFEPSQDQTMVRDLARSILDKEMSPERAKAAEAGADGFDRELWATFAEAGLLGLAVPEAFGGMGLGVCELASLLIEVGRATAPLPVLPTLVLGGTALHRFGTDQQQQRWLPRLAKGELLLSAALSSGVASEPGTPAIKASSDGEGWRLEGSTGELAAAAVAERILVPASTDRGPAIFLLDPQASGVTLSSAQTSSGTSLSTLELSAVAIGADDLLGGRLEGTEEALAWLHAVALASVAALQLGVCERALEMTTAYVREREQFGVPIGTFQAVQHRAADCYIDLECMRWTLWRAVCRLNEGLEVTNEALVAKFWAAEAGARITDAALHLHAGIGVDTDYPIHRYFLWSRALGLCLGSASRQLAGLGQRMAANPPELPA